MNRRTFLGLSLAAGAAGFLDGCKSVPGLAAGRSACGKLRLGSIGCGSQGKSDIKDLATHKRVEMAAFCDVDETMLEPLKVKFPKARFYRNWIEMLDREDLDAVLVATPDHQHFRVMSEVLRRGLNLYSEKPLCRSFAECHELERLAREKDVVTQLGTQCAAWECDRYTALDLQQKKIGTVKKVWLFSNTGYYEKLLERKWPLEAAPVPETLDWKEWLGDAPFRPYVPNAYHSFVWRVWKDFGSGWLGDMGSHLFSPVWLGLSMGRSQARSARAEVYDAGWSAAQREQFIPMFSHITWRFPGIAATGGKDFDVEWCDGPSEGNIPKEFLPEGETEKLRQVAKRVMPAQYLPPVAFRSLAARTPLGGLPIQGRVVEGTDGWLISTHFNKPPVLLDAKGKSLGLELPYEEPSPSHYHEFIDCCLDGGKARHDFSWTSKLTDWLLLGRQAIDNPGKEVKMA